MVLISTCQELQDNARSFVAALESGCPFLVARLGLFRRWYYFHELNIFAPSKFVGYVGMSCDTYQIAWKQGSDGRETENHIRRIFQLEDVTLLKAADLKAFLVQFAKKANAKTSIHLITGRKQ